MTDARLEELRRRARENPFDGALANQLRRELARIGDGNYEELQRRLEQARNSEDGLEYTGLVALTKGRYASSIEFWHPLGQVYRVKIPLKPFKKVDNWELPHSEGLPPHGSTTVVYDHEGIGMNQRLELVIHGAYRIPRSARVLGEGSYSINNDGTITDEGESFYRNESFGIRNMETERTTVHEVETQVELNEVTNLPSPFCANGSPYNLPHNSKMLRVDGNQVQHQGQMLRYLEHDTAGGEPRKTMMEVSIHIIDVLYRAVARQRNE